MTWLVFEWIEVGFITDHAPYDIKLWRKFNSEGTADLIVSRDDVAYNAMLEILDDR